MSAKTKKIIFGFLALILIFSLLGWKFSSHHTPHQHKMDAVTVTVATAQAKSMPLELGLPGTIESVESVSVRAQVTGILKKINFTPGAEVKAGDILFEINADTFSATLAQAKANLARDMAQYDETKKNEERLRILVDKNFVSRQDYGAVVSQAAMQKATIEADNEKIKEAQLQLEYTKILAPIDGKTGDVSVKIGDLITSAGAEPLVTINKIDPVYVNFNLPQSRLTNLLLYKKEGPIQVQVWSEDNTQKLASGDLVFIDNAVNTNTGTVLLKAQIPNQNELLWPSQLVMVKLILTIQQNALVVPSAAVKSDDQGRFIYVVENNTAQIKRVEVERQVGKFTIIKSGLNAGDTVITTAPPELVSGAPIKISTADQP